MKPLAFFLRYLKKNIIWLMFIILSVFVTVSAELAQPFLLGQAIDHALNNQDLALFIVFISISAGLALLGVLSGFLFEYFVGKLSQEIVYDLRRDIYNKINKVSISTLYEHRVGNLIQYEIADIENISNGISAVLKSLFRGILAAMITIVMMMCVNWILALIVIFLTPLSVVVSRFIAKSNHKYFKEQAKLQSSLNEISLEAIWGSDVIQAFGNEYKVIRDFVEQDKLLKKKGVLAQFAASWVNPSTRLVNNTIYVVIGILGIIMIYVSDLGNITEALLAMMSLGRLSSFLSYTTQYTKPFNEISSVISEYELAKTSLERICTFMNSDNDTDEGKKEIKSISSIEFKDMSFSYDKNKSLIEHFNLSIKKGDKVAIVGPTGAGKSTLINVLLRYYDNDAGEILINGTPYKEISKSSLRNNFGLVLQETWIFNGTILDNIRYAKKEASKEEVMEACKKCHAHELIMTLPFGYETKITSKDDLSEGEKQMLSIARVMLANRDVVILDEATSNIDTHTEKLINNAFDEVLKGKTSIVIAHRLSTIVNADTILVLNDGAIVEQGSHKELVKKNGLYSKMYSSQFSK